MWVMDAEDPMTHSTLRKCFLSCSGCQGRLPGEGGLQVGSYKKFLRVVAVSLCFHIDKSWHSRHMVNICRERKGRFTLF